MRPLLLILSLCCLAHGSFAAPPRPNIIFLMCDDLGYGDVHCLNPTHGKIATPGIDRLAAQGMTFTDAHSGSSVCTPTRYGVMTGRYSWRTKLQSGVVEGFAPSLIAADRPTVASFLRSAGYHTAIIGKWHLNFEYLDPKTGKAYSAKDFNTPPVGARIPDGPVARGFDYYHGFHHARDMEAVIENDTVIEHDEVVHMLPRLRRKAVEFIDSRKGKEQPFFLYLPLGSPHTPIVPAPEWKGKSGLGDYGDFVMQTDDVAVAVAEALERNGMTENTLIIFTSDNGCSKAAGIDKLARQGHLVSANMRGSKADIWDGGHRIPFIARWPGQIAAGSTCDQLICLVDFFATAAEVVGRPVPAGSCEDSVSFLPALKGRPIVSTRHGVIHHSISGHFAYRQGPWKLALARGSGGWSSPNEKQMPAGSPKGQLYDMQHDIGETTNLFETKPEIVSQLLDFLKADIERGRSTEGPDSANDFADIVLWKSENAKKGKKKK
ncbi:arylsulfatase [Prosthecobacter sp.]|uniref:arylsulfatase n=1 Tax=Prosthecobacter sp. TaxID=1965333 RepID=UPI003783807B